MLDSIKDTFEGVKAKIEQYQQTYCQPYYYVTASSTALSYITYSALYDYCMKNETLLLSSMKDWVAIIFLGNAIALGVGIAKPEWVELAIDNIKEAYYYLDDKDYNLFAVAKDARAAIYDMANNTYKNIHDFYTDKVEQAHTTYSNLFAKNEHMPQVEIITADEVINNTMMSGY